MGRDLWRVPESAVASSAPGAHHRYQRREHHQCRWPTVHWMTFLRADRIHDERGRRWRRHMRRSATSCPSAWAASTSRVHRSPRASTWTSATGRQFARLSMPTTCSRRGPSPARGVGGGNSSSGVTDGPPPQWVPAAWWLVGLGHPGQANAWVLAWLGLPAGTEITLQDDGVLSDANHSTGILTQEHPVLERKTRQAARSLEAIGLTTRVGVGRVLL